MTVKRPMLQIDAIDVFGDDARAVALGLLAHFHHELGAENSIRESRKVFDFRCEIQLPQRKRPAQAVVLGNRAFIDERVEIRAGGVNRARPRGGAGTDDHDLLC